MWQVRTLTCCGRERQQCPLRDHPIMDFAARCLSDRFGEYCRAAWRRVERRQWAGFPYQRSGRPLQPDQRISARSISFEPFADGHANRSKCFFSQLRRRRLPISVDRQPVVRAALRQGRRLGETQPGFDGGILHRTSSISLMRQVLSKNGSSGL